MNSGEALRLRHVSMAKCLESDFRTYFWSCSQISSVLLFRNIEGIFPPSGKRVGILEFLEITKV